MKYVKWLLGILLLIGIGFVLTNTAAVKDWLQQFLEWVQQLGFWGAASLAVLYAVAVVFMFPASILTLGAGFAFGVLWGTVTVSIASVTGATLAFLLGRTLLREKVAEKVKGNPKFESVDRAVEQNGFKIVALTRLSPAFPFTLLNYMYGLTGVSLKNYVLASWIGMLPGTVMYVYLGSVAQSLASVASGETRENSGQQVLLYIGLAATIAVTILITRIAKKALQDEVPAVEEPHA